MQLLCLQEYYTSGFLSIQAAIDGYVLGLNAETETSLGPFPASAQNGTSRLRPQSAQQELFTEWGEHLLSKACMSTELCLLEQALKQASPLHALKLCRCCLPRACGTAVKDSTDWGK